ncbi:TSUP family transporter [Desulfomarina sp.]
MESIDISSTVLLTLLLVGLLSGFIDSVAGGGGLIALPALLFVGLPPQIALGTNKLQGSFGTLSAAWNYISNKQISLKKALPGMLFTLIGASGGAMLVQSLDPSFIQPLIPVLLLLVFFHTLLSKDLGRKDTPAIMRPLLFHALFGLLLGFYDGFFGPGTGSFWTVAFMFFAGFNMTRATGYTKIMNFTSNIVALTWFIIGGNIIWSVGLTMAVGQIIGARIGSGMAISRGTAFIRPLFLTVVFLTIARLAYLNFFSIT